MSKFKVGDRVFHVGYGIGTVTSSYSDFTFGVTVDFDINQRRDVFTADGRPYEEHNMPSLLTIEEARAHKYDVPKEKVKKWMWVLKEIISEPDAVEVTRMSISECPYSEEHARRFWGTMLVQKIDSTEIEVDE